MIAPPVPPTRGAAHNVLRTYTPAPHNTTIASTPNATGTNRAQFPPHHPYSTSPCADAGVVVLPLSARTARYTTMLTASHLCAFRAAPWAASRACTHAVCALVAPGAALDRGIMWATAHCVHADDPMLSLYRPTGQLVHTWPTVSASWGCIVGYCSHVVHCGGALECALRENIPR